MTTQFHHDFYSHPLLPELYFVLAYDTQDDEVLLYQEKNWHDMLIWIEDEEQWEKTLNSPRGRKIGRKLSQEAQRDIDAGNTFPCEELHVKQETEQRPNNAMNILYSSEDGCYIVHLPAWCIKNGGPCFNDFGFTHGTSYEEAAKRGLELLEDLDLEVRNNKIPPPNIPDSIHLKEV